MESEEEDRRGEPPPLSRRVPFLSSSLSFTSSSAIDLDLVVLLLDSFTHLFYVFLTLSFTLIRSISAILTLFALCRLSALIVFLCRVGLAFTLLFLPSSLFFIRLFLVCFSQIRSTSDLSL